VKDRIAIICAPVEGSSDQIEGSVQLNCEECGQAVWCAPTGRKAINKMGPLALVLCMGCGMERIVRDPDPEILPPTEEQVVEIERHWERR